MDRLHGGHGHRRVGARPDGRQGLRRPEQHRGQEGRGQRQRPRAAGAAGLTGERRGLGARGLFKYSAVTKTYRAGPD